MGIAPAEVIGKLLPCRWLHSKSQRVISLFLEIASIFQRPEKGWTWTVEFAFKNLECSSVLKLSTKDDKSDRDTEGIRLT